MSFSRRNFIKCGMLTGATVALTACQRNVEHKLVSQYQMPEYALPGQALYWATNCGECFGGCGLAAKTTDGRAIKLDGIPEHPLSRGGICARGQSALQVAYHPNRLNGFQGAEGKAEDKTWKAVFDETLSKLEGSNPVFVTRSLKGNLGGLMVELAKKYKGKIWVLDFPGRLAERQVMKALTGKAELPHYKLEEADYVVTFGGDLLNLGHNSVLSNWGYGQFRQGRGRDRGTMVSVSSRINMTAANSDRWLAVRPGTEGWVALAIGNLLAAKGKKSAGWPAWAKSVSLEKVAEVTGLEAKLIERLADMLGKAKQPLCIPDSDAGNYVNGVESLYVIHALNKMLRGSVDTWEPENVLGVSGGVPAGLIVNTEQALKAIAAESTTAVWIFDVDVVRLLPESLKVGDALAGKAVSFSTFANDTTRLSMRTVPIVGWLEDWGDQRITGSGLDAYNVQQPVITSDWSGARSLGDILTAILVNDPIALTGAGPEAKPGAAKGKTFRDRIRGNADQARWEHLLARGGAWKEASLDWEEYPNRVSTPPPVVADPGSLPAGVNPFESLSAASVSSWTQQVTTGPVLVPFATLALKDGSLGNRPWMQELPDPISTVVWGAWVEINPETAEKLGVKRHDLIEIAIEGGGKIVAPVMPLPSVHPDCIAVPVGDEKPDYSAWGKLDFGMGQKVFGRYGYTNANYGKGGVNPLKHVKAEMTGAGEPRWVGHKVTLGRPEGKKSEMITAMDIRVFNLPREILPFE